MTNAQLYLAVGIPTFMVLVGIVLNQVGQGRIENRLTTIEGDLRNFYATQGHHEATLDIVKKKLDL